MKPEPDVRPWEVAKRVTATAPKRVSGARYDPTDKWSGMFVCALDGRMTAVRVEHMFYNMGRMVAGQGQDMGLSWTTDDAVRAVCVALNIP